MNTKTKKLVISAMLIAVASVLSIFQPFRLPFGGGITIASMAPIVLISCIYGLKWGFFSSFIFAVIQILLGGKTVAAFFLPGESQMVIWQAALVCLLDYILAYAVLGVGGIFRNKLKSRGAEVALGAFLAVTLRFVMHIISGTVFFGAWAQWFFSQEGFYRIGAVILERFSGNILSFIYSVFYNGTYMIPEIIITTLVTPIIYKALKRNKMFE